MKLLSLHSDFVEFEPKKKAIKSAEEAEMAPRRVEECLVVFTSIEEGDEKNIDEVVRLGVEEISRIARDVGADRIVVYPWVHLSNRPAKPDVAITILKRLAESLSRDFEVERAPFGWYKAFTVKCKGHPLSELSREIHPTSEKKEEEEVSQALMAEEKLVSHWYILDVDGSLVPVEEFDFSGHENLKKFADYEISKVRTVDRVPPHVKLMRQMELVDYEPGSDPGNLRWYPKGELIKNLMEDHVTNLLLEYGAMKVETPIMYDFEHPNLSRYLNRFPARQYTVLSGDKKYFLRFAACFGQYLIKHDMTISYRHLPVRLYELTHYSFRREQKGELVGLRRLRTFTMPDMHTLVADMEAAKEEFRRQMELSMRWMSDMGLDYEVGIRFVRDFFEENREFANQLVKMLGRPVLIEMWDERPFYFVMKFEFNIVDALDKASALSTVQIDIENTKRFGITYVDQDGSEKHPLMLHASISGGIDRNLYALLEQEYMKSQKGEKPCFPLWLAPTQVRVCPVSNEFVDAGMELVEFLSSRGIRADIDDRDVTLPKKVRDAEREWVPYVVVLGKKEAESGVLSVRCRKENQNVSIDRDALVEKIKSQTEGKPFRPLYLPKRLSRRPVFVG